MSGPQQFVSVNGVNIPTSEFVKQRDVILNRKTTNELTKGQMMHKTPELKTQEDVEKYLKDTTEKDDETLVLSVENEDENIVEDVEPTNTTPEEKIDEVEEKTEEAVIEAVIEAKVEKKVVKSNKKRSK